MITNRILFSYFIFFIVLISSCKTVQKTTETTEKKEVVIKSDPPLYISPAKTNRTVYVNIPNLIKIHTPSGHTAHLDVTALGGKVVEVDTKKGLYNLIIKDAGIAIELVAEEKSTGKKAFVTYNAIAIPAPQINMGAGHTITTQITTKTIKQQSTLIANYASYMPIKCGVVAYKLIRIPAKGKREEVINNSSTKFDDPTLALLAKGTQGDIYIFTDIKTNCGKQKPKSIMYILEE